MGSRASFENVNIGDFRFVENGQNYNSVGEYENVKILVQNSGNVKAPEYSHTANRIYATIQDGQLKHLTWYGDNHEQTASVDFLHRHNGLIPHVHYKMDHTIAFKPQDEMLKLADKIRRRYSLQ